MERIPQKRNFLSKKVVTMLGKRGLICYITDGDVPALKGIDHGSDVFSGPQVVHLDLTNRCNLDCIACWCNSPFLNRQSVLREESNITLPFHFITDFIDDLVEMGGTDQIKLGGGGEPTMYPHFDDVIRYIRNRGRDIDIDINTNFTLFNKHLIDLILETEVKLLTVSLWAGTPETYVKTHPNQSGKTFIRIVDKLKELSALRKNGLPRISIHNVIMNSNFHEMAKMVYLALEVGADEVNFVLVDPIPGKTEHLLLNKNDKSNLLNNFKQLKSNIDCFDMYRDPDTGKTVRVANYLEMLRRLSQSDIDVGSYDYKIVDRIPCYIGWIFTRVMADGRVAPCCKGHRMAMGNLHQHRFKTIWHSSRYKRFRMNGLILGKSSPYYSLMGNNLSKTTGCYNCDNLMHNMVVHRKILYKSNILKLAKFEMYQWFRR